MLYPIFDELVALKYKVPRHSPPSNRTVATAVGNHGSPFRGQGLEFEEVRRYAPGDDIRAIDWRVTARTGIAHTKVFREERERSVMICIDVNPTMRFGTRRTFKSIQAAHVAALLAWQTIMNHDKLGACLFGDIASRIHFFPPHRSQKIIWAFFKYLTYTDIKEDASPVSLEDMLTQISQAIPMRALVYIISDFQDVNEALEKQLRNLRRHADIVLIPIDDPADQFIPPLGLLRLSGSLHEKICINTNDRIGRTAYTAQWHNTRQALQTIAYKLKIGIIPITTDADPVSDLFFAQGKFERDAINE